MQPREKDFIDRPVIYNTIQWTCLCIWRLGACFFDVSRPDYVMLKEVYVIAVY
jgi:hypothetical protein